MTVEFFFKYFKKDKGLTSDQTFEYKPGANIPLYAIDERKDEPGNKEYIYYSFNPKTHSYSTRGLFWDEAMLVHNLFHNEPERLRAMLNDGSLYKTIVQKVQLANKEVDKITADWEKQDRECQLAKANGNIEKHKKLLNNLRLLAQSEVYRTLF